ncbi:protein-disulfide isomerase [Pseudomonas sp. NFX224]|uniref:protein-disulfide isomerase n=1 Tax=Pseudomonas sp. NFX224 TaxID=3402862 RepID=UPI003AFB72EF
MNPEWAQYAWGNDQRIGGMTGQIFSERYREQVLAKTEGKFDSSAMNRALTQAHTIDQTLEPKLLSALQVARYVDGQDTCDYSVVAGIATQLLIGTGLETNADTLSVRLFADEDLAKRTHARTSTAQALIGRFDLRGIPQLLVRTENITIPLNSSHLYQGVEKLVTEIRKTVVSAQISAVSPRNLAHGRR